MPKAPGILLVDDERDNLDALKRLLRKDFEVFTATSGEEALKILEPDANAIFAIVSDQRMPGMQGAELLEKVKNLDDSITRLLITGFSDLEAVTLAINQGEIWRYIAKPWEPSELQITIRQAVERCRLLRDLRQREAALEQAAVELKAKDWARGRLLTLLLHELKTLPQSLEALRELSGPGDEASRKSFIERIEQRLKLLQTDIEDLLGEEKSFAVAKRSAIGFEELAKLLGAELKGDSPSASVMIFEAQLKADLKLLAEVLAKNTLKAKPLVSIKAITDPEPLIFATFSLPKSARPSGLEKEISDSVLSWTVLFEPFVGTEQIEHHSTGLRVEVARLVRRLAVQGARLSVVNGKAGTVDVQLDIRAPKATTGPTD
jgi:CheY-like chemotaxis protein